MVSGNRHRAEAIGIYTSSLSPREERVGRELERGESQQNAPPLLSPLLLPTSGGEGEMLRSRAFLDLCNNGGALLGKEIGTRQSTLPVVPGRFGTTPHIAL